MSFHDAGSSIVFAKVIKTKKAEGLEKITLVDHDSFLSCNLG